MENQIVYHAIPDTALSVLEMFQPTKEGITLFAAKVINDVNEGRADALRVKVLCKALEDIGKKIDEGTKEAQATEAAKYGERPFDFFGRQLHLTTVHTDIDYDSSEDVVYKRLTDLKANLDAQIKERQEFLKAIKHPQTLVDDATGEVYTVKPCHKKQTQGVKVVR